MTRPQHAADAATADAATAADARMSARTSAPAPPAVRAIAILLPMLMVALIAGLAGCSARTTNAAAAGADRAESGVQFADADARAGAVRHRYEQGDMAATVALVESAPADQRVRRSDALLMAALARVVLAATDATHAAAQTATADAAHAASAPDPEAADGAADSDAAAQTAAAGLPPVPERIDFSLINPVRHWLRDPPSARQLIAYMTLLEHIAAVGAERSAGEVVLKAVNAAAFVVADVLPYLDAQDRDPVIVRHARIMALSRDLSLIGATSNKIDI